MNKKEILNILKKYNLKTEKYIIISSAAMVLNNIKKETKDIDISVEKDYEKELLKNYKCELEREIMDNNKKYKAYMIDDIINFSTHYYGEYKTKKIEGYNVQRIEEILKLKQRLNREKDKKDIILLKEEIEIVKRARNHKSHSSKSADIITYKKSTGIEALIGYLEITNNKERIKEIMKYIVGE